MPEADVIVGPDVKPVEPVVSTDVENPVAPVVEPENLEAGQSNEYTEDEQTATDAGWKPKDQWEGDPKKWVPADEFNRRGELFGKIDNVSKDLRETKKVLRMLQDHHSRVKETEYNRAIAQLREAKKQAMVDGDAEVILNVDERLMDMKAARTAAVQQAQQPQAPDPRFTDWLGKNSWYAQDGEMKEFADDIGIAHAKSHPDKDPLDVLKYVDQRVRKSYPERFTNPNRNRPSAVAGRESQGSGRFANDNFKLSNIEEEIMKTFVRDGVMTKEQYIADIKSVRGN